MKKTALSGIQSSGNLHLGNYLGAIKNWLKMQQEYGCFFFLADLHAITVPQIPEKLHNNILESTAIYLASGLDPDKSSIFLQSSIKEHTEFAWLLSCNTPIGWLKRMTQFKDKAGKNQDNSNTGLFTYPILMAADILLYNADVIPVGDDQKQHIELTRDIAGAVNRKFNQEILKMPEPLIQGTATRIMSLRDGNKKMSKSDPSPASRIHINDNPDVIMSKMKKAKTDNMDFISYDAENRPEISNLINIYSALTGQDKTTIVDQYKNSGFAKFKTDITQLIIEEFKPINSEYNRIIKDQAYIMEALDKGTKRAKVVAETTCNRLKEMFGFVV